MSYMYIAEQGATIHKDGNRIVATKDNDTIFERPIKDISGIIILGNIQLTTQAIKFLLNNDKPLSILNQNGQFKGKLVSATHKNAGEEFEQPLFFFI